MTSKSIKNIVLIHTPCPELENDRLEPPLGILYLATLLGNEGIPCRICDLSGIPEEEWKYKIGMADVYAFSTYSFTYTRTLKILNIVKKLNPNAVTIAGGPHVSALPNESANDFDIIITGEAEITLLQVIRAIQKGELIKGILMGETVKNLDQLPFPDYQLIELSSYSRTVEGFSSISLMSSRGCPYNCLFCNSRLFSRGQLRFRSPQNVAQEISLLKKRYNVHSFRFNDDLFTFSEERIKEMADALKPLGILYRVFARSNNLTKEATKQLYESGCRHVAIGIESMSEKMLKLFNKRATVQENIEALRNAKAAGLKVRIYLLIGFPGETEKTVKESLDVLLNCDFDEFMVYPFIPYPGTAVWNNPEFYGARIDRDFTKYLQIGHDRNTTYAVTTDGFTPEDVKYWVEETIEALEKKSLWGGKSSLNR